MKRITLLMACAFALVMGLNNNAHADYLNNLNMTVEVGAGTSADPFENVSTAQSLANIIDAPSADAIEDHNQSSHVWVTGETLNLVFELNTDYDLTEMHLWNYYTETYDVDDIDLRFLDADENLISEILNIAPSVGTNPTSAEDITISASGVRYIQAALTGSNGQVDFNNLGFTATATIPEPTSALLLGLVLGGMIKRRRVK